MSACNGRLFIPSRIAGVLWLESYCGKPCGESGLCATCQFSNLLGTIDDDVPSWVNMWGGQKSNNIVLSVWDRGIVEYASAQAKEKNTGVSLKTCNNIRIDMAPKRKVGTGVPLLPKHAITIRSNVYPVNIHYIEEASEPREISDIIYKKVKKVVVNSMVCYKDGDVHYACGPNGEINGVVT